MRQVVILPGYRLVWPRCCGCPLSFKSCENDPATSPTSWTGSETESPLAHAWRRVRHRRRAVRDIARVAHEASRRKCLHRRDAVHPQRTAPLARAALRSGDIRLLAPARPCRASARLRRHAAFVIGVFAVAQISGIMYAYRLRWTWLFGMLAMVLVVWTGWKELERRYPTGAARNLAPDRARPDRHGQCRDRRRRGTCRRTAGTALGHPRTPRTRHEGRASSRAGRRNRRFRRSAFTPGLFLALERQGVPARVTVDPYHFFGDGTQRLHSGGPVRATLFVAIDKDVDRFWRAPNVKLLSYWGTVPIDQRERIVDEIQRRQPAIDEAFAAGRLTAEEHLLETQRLERTLPSAPGTIGEGSRRIPQEPVNRQPRQSLNHRCSSVLQLRWQS